MITPERAVIISSHAHDIEIEMFTRHTVRLSPEPAIKKKMH